MNRYGILKTFDATESWWYIKHITTKMYLEVKLNPRKFNVLQR